MPPIVFVFTREKKYTFPLGKAKQVMPRKLNRCGSDRPFFFFPPLFK